MTQTAAGISWCHIKTCCTYTTDTHPSNCLHSFKIYNDFVYV